MLHRMVSRSVGVVSVAALSLGLAACEDNTEGTPLPPPPPSTAVYVTPVEADYTTKDSVVALFPDTTVTVVTPQVVFHVTYPDGTNAVGQIVQFSTTFGFVENRSATVDENGNVSPGVWVVSCRTQPQRVIATPAAGSTGFIDVDVTGVPPQFCPFETEPPPP